MKPIGALAIFLIILVVVAAGLFYKIIIPKVQPKTEVKKVWGAYTGNTPGSITSFENQVGARPDISAIFVDFGDSFLNNLAEPVKNNKQTLLIFWEPNTVSLDEIISGRQDSYVKNFAAQILQYKNPVILVPMEEANGNWDAWDGTVKNNSSEKFISAWQRIHDLFSKVSNVKWGWSVNSDSVPNTSANAISNYYPGNNYVDYVGVDGFNFGNPWQSFSNIFSATLQQLKIYNKPIYIFSMACAQDPQKSAWITDAMAQIKSNPSVAGWIWFNENKEQNWLVNSDAASLAAFKNSIK